jgi:hypothetical protein
MSTTPILHGDHRGYARGCRCKPCTRGHARYMAEWRAGKQPSAGQMFLLSPESPSDDSEPVLRRATPQTVSRVGQATAGRMHSQARETERAAAASLVPTAGSKRAIYLMALVDARHRGLTDHEASALLRLPVSSINGRRNELIGWIEDSGRTRIGPYGKPNSVWVATERGRRWAKKQGAA